MKIAYTISGLYNSGGMENILVRKANYLVEVYKHDITIITTDQSGRPSFYPISHRISQIDLGINYDIAKQSKLWHIKKMFLRRIHKKKLRQFLMSKRFDVVISMLDFDMDFLPEIKDGSAKIAEFHFSRYYKSLSTDNPIIKLIQYLRTLYWKKILKRYDRFVVLTQMDKEQWGKMHNIEVIPNFIIPSTSTPLVQRSTRIISVGRICFQKGFDLLLRAWMMICDQIPNWELVIIGGGDKTKLNNFVYQNKVKNVKILDATPNIDQEYLQSSFYVMSSRFEGLPLVLLEAMNCGLPIVSFDCPCGPSDILTNKFGILVPVGNVRQLSDRILFVSKNPEWREQASQHAIAHSKLYSIEMIMPKWETLFRSIVKENSSERLDF